MIKAIDEGHNQYSRVLGIPEFVKKIALVYGKKLRKEVNPMTEILVGAGANSIINSLIYAIIDPSKMEEVIVFEPCFPQYQDHIQMSGGKYVPVPLELKEGKWVFNIEHLNNALSSKTKIVILNNAHNPTGKLFTREELEGITNALQSYPNVIVISDDVYEFLVFDGKETTLFASIGDNFSRTVSVFSGGKLFSATGWKVGWGIGPADIINAAGVISTATIYCVNAPAQVAMARCLGEIIESHPYKEHSSYLEHAKWEFEQVRDYMMNEFNKPFDLPVIPLTSESGFFVMLDISKCIPLIPIKYQESHDYEDFKEGENPVSKNRVHMPDSRIPYDLAFCRWMAVERKVIMMPNSLFYNKESPFRTDNLVRLSICKGLDHSSKAVMRMKGKLKTD